jgi:hypothetical protein
LSLAETLRERETPLRNSYIGSATLLILGVSSFEVYIAYIP